MANVAERNRQIKKVLSGAFGTGKVKVRGSRGTGYGWVSVDIDWTPRDADQASAMRTLCKQLLRTAKIDLGRTYTDDTCQYETDQCHINFNRARYLRTQTGSDGTLFVQREWNGEWEIAA